MGIISESLRGYILRRQPDGTPLEKVDLRQAGSQFCKATAFDIVKCPTSKGRLVVQVVRGGVTQQIFPGPLAATTTRDTGYLRFPVAAAICAVPAAAPTTSPTVVSDGSDLRIEVATAYFKDDKNVTWIYDVFTSSTSNRSVPPFIAVIPR